MELNIFSRFTLLKLSFGRIHNPTKDFINQSFRNNIQIRYWRFPKNFPFPFPAVWNNNRIPVPFPVRGPRINRIPFPAPLRPKNNIRIPVPFPARGPRINKIPFPAPPWQNNNSRGGGTYSRTCERKNEQGKPVVCKFKVFEKLCVCEPRGIE